MKVKKIIGIAGFCVMMIAVLVLTTIFLIGEPIAGAQMAVTAKLDGQILTVDITTVESAVALRGWKVRQMGDELFITGRKVLVSPFFDRGSHCLSVDVKSIETVYLGGQMIWTAGGERK